MSSADWTILNDSLSAGSVDRGVTTGIARPPSTGANNFLYGFNSLVLATGAVGLFANGVNFAPTAKGVSVRGAVKRGLSGGPLGYAPFLFAGIQGTSVNDLAYMLGFADGDPSHLVLKKGTLATGLPDLAPDAPNNGVLLRSDDTFLVDTWKHIRLDMVVNTNGDVLLQCFENDLDTNPLNDPPVWTAIPGMSEFVDDALQINTGSAPFTTGRHGFGFYTEDVTRRGFFDQIEVLRQL
jgi:hypothetical protein